MKHLLLVFSAFSLFNSQSFAEESSFGGIEKQDVEKVQAEDVKLESVNFVNPEWKSYVWVNVSGMVNRFAGVGVGIRKEGEKNGIDLGLELATRKDFFRASSNVSYLRFFNPFGSFDFYGGVGMRASFMDVDEFGSYLVLEPRALIGKQFSFKSGQAQFVELRSVVGTYFESLSGPSRHGAYMNPFNFEVLYGIVF